LSDAKLFIVLLRLEPVGVPPGANR
jgi:hypothetical protein